MIDGPQQLHEGTFIVDQTRVDDLLERLIDGRFKTEAGRARTDA